jgi:hypothetical protein
MLVKSDAVSVGHNKNKCEVGNLMRAYIKYVMLKHIQEEGALIYAWDGFEKDEGQFSLPLIKAYGLHVMQVIGGRDIASVMFMTSGRLGELFGKMNFSRVVVLNINNNTGDQWVSIGTDDIDKILSRAIVATRADDVDIDVTYFKDELATLKFLGDSQ